MPLWNGTCALSRKSVHGRKGVNYVKTSGPYLCSLCRLVLGFRGSLLIGGLH
uniref:Uncharacterized protein n=1 Tax=Anguilla anguilla TaxID=7936 RepID=A0A0E9PBD7_ANGAN